jgi:hypothetical protein
VRNSDDDDDDDNNNNNNNNGTYREVTVDRPDVINKNKKHKTNILIDVAISADTNTTQKDA